MEGKESVDNSSTKNILKRCASRIFPESSVGILSSVEQVTSTKRKIFKFFLLIGCLSGFLYQSGIYLSVFFQYPTGIDMDVTTPDTFMIPAYTFCDNNRVNSRIFCAKFPDLCEEPSKDVCDKYPSYCGKNGTLKPKKENYEKYNTLRGEEIIELNKLEAHFQKRDKTIRFGNETITGPHFRLKHTHHLNLCYSLNERASNSLLPLTSSNKNILKIPVDVLSFKIKADEVFLPGNRAGILFEVHSPFEGVNPLDTGIFMRPGRTYVIYVTTDEEILQKSPYDTDCVNHTELWEKRGRSGPRSHTMCSHNCGAEMSFLCFGCVMPFYLYPRKEKYCELEAEVFRNKNCPDDTSEHEEYCNKTCKNDCKETNFRITVQERFKEYYDRKDNVNEDIEDVINVEIYLDTAEVVVYKHYPKYSNNEVFSVIGGFIGIWLGMSLLDIFNFFEEIFKISLISFNKKRENKEKTLAT